MSKLFNNISDADKKMLTKIYWRSFAVFAGPCGAAYRQAPGFTMSIMPALERYYPEQEKRAEAMQRHMTPYNIAQNVGTFAMGLAASMEHENAVHYGDYDPSSIVSIKTALMGPLSGIGDSIYWGIVRCIAAGVGIGFAASGSILGPILFLVIYNLPGMLGRYYLTFLGFSMGENFITKAYESGMITILTKCAGIIGLMMVGFMISSNVSLSLALTMPVSGADDALLLGAEKENESEYIVICRPGHRLCARPARHLLSRNADSAFAAGPSGSVSADAWNLGFKRKK